MKGLKGVSWLAMVAVLPALAQPGSTPLPPDIDERSYSRLPLIQKDSLDAEGQRVFEAINGKESNTPRLGPPASTLYSVAAAEPYDRLNQLLRSANVIGPQFFEISTLVPAREFNQQYEWTAHERGARRVGVSQEVIANGRAVRRARHHRDHDGHGRLRDDGDAAQRGESTTAAGLGAVAPDALNKVRTSAC
jgi:hypothetical protein